MTRPRPVRPAGGTSRIGFFRETSWAQPVIVPWPSIQCTRFLCGMRKTVRRRHITNSADRPAEYQRHLRLAPHPGWVAPRCQPLDKCNICVTCRVVSRTDAASVALARPPASGRMAEHVSSVGSGWHALTQQEAVRQLAALCDCGPSLSLGMDVMSYVPKGRAVPSPAFQGGVTCRPPRVVQVPTGRQKGSACAPGTVLDLGSS